MKEIHKKIYDNTQQMEILFDKGNTTETKEEIEKMMAQQMEMLQSLDVSQEENRELMKLIVEKNKKMIGSIQGKQKELIEQVGKMSDTQENKKNYDLYK